jgi:RHS repeat-associated protein
LLVPDSCHLSGYDDHGELGDGTNLDSTVPVTVSNLSGVTAVAAGNHHSLAVKGDGTARAWGYNCYGQLGDGTTLNSSVPVTVSNLSGGTAVAAGGHHSLALPSDGTARAWGYNYYGQLGDGTRTNRTSPVEVSDLELHPRLQPQLIVAKYYYFSLQRVAMRRDGVLQYIAADHLGSTSLVLDDQGNRIAESRHLPYGEERWSWVEGGGDFPTEYRFTGQRDAGVGLYHMGARFYDVALARWISADTLVPNPQNPQSLNRYSWVVGNPLRFVDPSGHFTEDQIMQHFGVETWEEVLAVFEEGGELAGQWGWLKVLRDADFGATIEFLSDNLKPGAVLLYFTFAERVFEECAGGICPISNTLVRQATAFNLWAYGHSGWSPGADGPVHHRYSRSQMWIADRKYPVSRINWDKADRTGAVVDVIGIGGDVAFLFPGIGQIGWGASEIVEIWDWGRKWHKFEAGDPWDVVNEVMVQGLQAAKFLPEGGWVGNVLSLAANLMEGWECTP